MRVHSVSDLHCDNWELLNHPMATPALKVSGDILIINGDISDGELEKHLSKLTRHYVNAGLPVLYVPGNHDYYYTDINDGSKAMRQACANAGVVLLNGDAFVKEGVRFFGTTLWAAFDLEEHSQAMQMNMSKVLVADYKYIRGLSPQHTWHLHHQARLQIERQGHDALENDQQFVLVSHHAPLHECIPEKFATNPISGAYASDLANLLKAANVHTAVFGHMHGTAHGAAKSAPGTNLYINARGCLRGSALENAIPENPRFNYEGCFSI